MPVFWENVFWVATKCDVQSEANGSGDLGKWSADINKVFKVTSNITNFFSVGRDGSGDLLKGTGTGKMLEALEAVSPSVKPAN
jgi:hypothetical protein